jgi:hypothetical protein
MLNIYGLFAAAASRDCKTLQQNTRNNPSFRHGFAAFVPHIAPQA